MDSLEPRQVFYTDDVVGSSITLVDLKGNKEPWTWAVFVNRFDLCIKGKKTDHYFNTRESAVEFFKKLRDDYQRRSERPKD